MATELQPHLNQDLRTEELLSALEMDSEGLLSPEKIFDRSNALRATASKEANRFGLCSLVFCVFYLLKLAGVRLDLALLDTKVMEVPYGLSVFILAGNMSSSLALARFCDARASERTIATLAAAMWPKQKRAAFATMPNEHEWLTPSADALLFVTKRGFSRVVYNTTIYLTAIPLLVMVLLPVACSAWFLIDWKAQISTGSVNLQFWAVAIAFGLNFLWIIAYFALHNLTEVFAEE